MTLPACSSASSLNCGGRRGVFLARDIGIGVEAFMEPVTPDRPHVESSPDVVPARCRPATPVWNQRIVHSERSTSDVRYGEFLANLPCEPVGNLHMAGYRFDRAGAGVAPQRMRGALALEVAAVSPEMPQENTSLHGTTTVSRSASSGSPRNPSSRRSRRMSSIAFARLSRASRFVRPWPVAPALPDSTRCAIRRLVRRLPCRYCSLFGPPVAIPDVSGRPDVRCSSNHSRRRFTAPPCLCRAHQRTMPGREGQIQFNLPCSAPASTRFDGCRFDTDHPCR